MSRQVSRRQALAGGAAGVGMAGAAAAGAFGAGWRPLDGGQAAAQKPVSASGGNGMNVLVLIVDETRADHVGAYGSSVRTPNIDAFARSGTRFTRPYPEAMPTVPVRRAIHTGRRSFPFRDWQPWWSLPPLPGWEPIPQGQETLAQMLGQVGYTRLLLADTPFYMRAAMNLQQGATFRWTRGQKFDTHGLGGLVSDRTMDRYVVPDRWQNSVRDYLADALTWDHESQWPAARLYSDAASALRSLHRLQPFMLVVDTFEPHGPFYLPQPYRDMYGEFGGKVEPIQPAYGPTDYLTEAQLQRMRDLYSGTISFTDAWMGRVFDALESTGLAESTLVLLVSDHGILLGEHDLTGKLEHALYPEVTDIMMAARHPERGHGTTSDVFAGTHDITPTVLANLDITLDRPLDGADMLDPSSAVAAREYATSIYAHTLWARDSRHTLIAPDYGATKRLYDHRTDPHFRHDIAATNPEVVRRMWGYIQADAGGDIPRY